MGDTFVGIAKQLLSNDWQNKKLNPSLYEYLRDLNTMCERAGGQFISRQAIALAIKQWQSQHLADQPLVD